MSWPGSARYQEPPLPLSQGPTPSKPWRYTQPEAGCAFSGHCVWGLGHIPTTLATVLVSLTGSAQWIYGQGVQFVSQQTLSLSSIQPLLSVTWPLGRPDGLPLLPPCRGQLGV